ncbi:SLATT domain-containing protein [Sulfitobacter delicatus]|uniref:SMODS and SLOG-associating 2TM effector domain-containing protein n=1 Tax=Sulfitobacter delicatus TaxID=218672 RepID=A0A1G7XFQ9_9RHOB|nr:hypothetical protein SAMN04489759_112100 [Sulfitobacter delicatus]
MNEEEKEQPGDPFGNIWITSRTRMQSHAKYTRYDLISHIVLTAYSVLLLGFSVFSRHLSETKLGPYTSEVSIVLSLSVLCASLVIWGLKFGKTADQHRECYLALQRLYDDEDARKNVATYHQILDRYPNQSDFDYEAMLYKNVWSQNKELRDRSGVLKYSWWRARKFEFRQLSRIFGTLFVLTCPVIFLAVLYVAG